MGILLPITSYAQTQADIEAAQRQAEIIQRQEQERIQRDQEEARRRSERVDGMDTQTLQPKITVPAIGAPCREISAITINGAPNLPASVRQRITSEFTGRCLNVGDIERILAEITKYYIDKGFITTRAYLPPQDLTQGHLEILVVEGIVNKIMIDDGKANSISIGNVFPGIEGSLLNLRDLEQGIDQINRLTSNNAQLDIQPGDKPGTSIVVVHNKPRLPYHFNVSVDNQGSESTGELQSGFTASVDNLLGFNELFSATHRQAIPGYPGHKDSGSDNFSFNIPFGYTTLSLGTSRSKYESTIRVPSGLELISSGNSKTDSVRLDRVMYRDQTTRATLAATVTTKESKNYLDGQYLGVSSRNLTVLDVDGDLNTGLAGGVLTLNLGYAQGLNTMGALRDPDNLPDWAARAQFGKFKAGFNYARPFKLFNKDFTLTSQFTGQKAKDVLYGSEQISIGGIYSVRGFVRNVLSGDDGYYWRNEISMRQPIVIGNETISTRLYAGYDTGEVHNRTANIPQGRLAGMVVGISANWRGATWDFFNTRPLTLPDTMIKESSQTWFRVAYTY
ncbi:ShlB/FhaC/HecB family hemolysin secretion/activation protein [Sulfurirhabdus autotrophica]|nr:ShlB/FhaC/HecB family hemolysin secretion/activation protein [Sulfurirhabdus autotrophica]